MSFLDCKQWRRFCHLGLSFLLGTGQKWCNLNQRLHMRENGKKEAQKQEELKKENGLQIGNGKFP